MPLLPKNMQMYIHFTLASLLPHNTCITNITCICTLLLLSPEDSAIFMKIQEGEVNQRKLEQNVIF